MDSFLSLLDFTSDMTLESGNQPMPAEGRTEDLSLLSDEERDRTFSATYFCTI
ncbi:hypothetical protein CPC08DRAFT_712287, partial [Agrocybe pediades]